MKSKIYILIWSALFFILFFSYSTVYAMTGKTTSETTRLREKASTKSNIVTLISKDSEVEILNEEGEWYQVRYNDEKESYVGYIRKDIIFVQKNAVSENNEKDNKEQTQNDVSGTQEQINTISSENTQINQNQTEDSSNIVQQEIYDNSKAIASEIDEVQNTVQKGYKTDLIAKLDVKILPSISSSIIASINENTKIEVTDVINKWCYVQAENVSGWVLSSKIPLVQEENVQTPSETKTVDENEQTSETETKKDSSEQENKKETKKQVAYVSTETLNIREKPESNSKILLQVSKNTELTVLEKIDDSWSKVSTKGKTGYVSSKYLSNTKVSTSTRSEEVERKDTTKNIVEKKETPKQESTPIESTSSTSSTTGENVVAFAKKYLGSKYVSGGMSPSTGFDCSGFTTYIFKNFGISLNRTSSAQASNGIAVSRSNLQAGDIVIFNNSANSGIGHVGIYIGGNSFIHAANSKKGVIITSLSDSYYSIRYVTARRVIN